MIQISQVKLPVKHSRKELEHKIKKLLRISGGPMPDYEIRRRSIDARKKPELYYSYVIWVKMDREDSVIRRARDSRVTKAETVSYRFPSADLKSRNQESPRPVIIGTGPAGLFCGYMLAVHGYRPLILERGCDVDTRVRDVERFWENGTLKADSNVPFGEGGAGTFSDGKLNTLVKDKEGRNRKVLEIFVEAGADPSVLYESKPHIGTDVLVKVVKQMRRTILEAGGEIRFGAKMTDLHAEDGRVRGIVVNDAETIACQVLVLAIGHSARDTFFMLSQKKVPMEAKNFAVGFRVEHPQKQINLSQYGRMDVSPLTAAPYKLTAQAARGRSVFSFCMCPGGYVVNASSEQGRLAVNGMSYSRRDGSNANSAIIVSVTKEDFADGSPLAGIAFQRKLEEKAFQAGKGKIPVQRLGDFKKKYEERIGRKISHTPETVCEKHLSVPDYMPCMKGKYCFSDISGLLPEVLTEAFLDGMEQFGRRIPGFSSDDTLVSAVESRTSSPVRITRDDTGESGLKGLYPCGEGAGYAGGIMSAAMDGLRTAERIAAIYGKADGGMNVE